MLLEVQTLLPTNAITLFSSHRLSFFLLHPLLYTTLHLYPHHHNYLLHRRLNLCRLPLHSPALRLQSAPPLRPRLQRLCQAHVLRRARRPLQSPFSSRRAPTSSSSVSLTSPSFGLHSTTRGALSSSTRTNMPSPSSSSPTPT